MGLFGPPNVEKLRARRDFDGLIKALDYKKSESVSSHAAEALGQIGDARAVEALIATLGQMWPAAKNALAKIGSPAVESLLAVLESPTLSRRSDAAEVLGQIRDPRAVEPLIALLNDGSEVMRRVAARALGQIGDIRATWPLIAALRDNRIGLGEANAALGKIGWRPGNDKMSATYWASQEEWDKCVAIGRPLLNR